MTDIVPAPPPHGEAAPADLGRVELIVREQLVRAGLPVDQVFTDVSERHTMLAGLSGVLAGLDPDTLARSHYISKMVAAAAVGLFDAALNYLWDELVNELHRRVARSDLQYFFEVAAGNSYLRKHLRDASDLGRIDDVHLLRAARDTGLITGAEFHDLDHIRFMRNHASAAHPNRVVLTGPDLAYWLRICIEVISYPDARGRTGP